jgi:hypothetical protein
MTIDKKIEREGEKRERMSEEKENKTKSVNILLISSRESWDRRGEERRRGGVRRQERRGKRTDRGNIIQSLTRLHSLQ